MSETFKLVKLLDPIQLTTVTGGLVPKGAYNAATDYAVGDSVDYNGSSYVMFSDAPAATLPTNTLFWQILANKGDTGATGATGTGTTINVRNVNQKNLTGSGITALTGSVNSSNTAFTVSSGLYASGTLEVYKNGVLQPLGDAITQTTPASGIFNFVTAPTTGDQIIAYYNISVVDADGFTSTDITDFQTAVSANTDVAANTAARHTHSNQAVLDATTASYTTANDTKLSGIATGATANSTDATLLARANHTGQQLASTISDFSTAADARVSAAVGVTVQAFDSDLTAFAAKTAPTGAVVGTTDTQVLSGKTLSSPAITDATNITFGTTTGTRIGATTSDKLALWNTTPITQPGATADDHSIFVSIGARANGTAFAERVGMAAAALTANTTLTWATSGASAAVQPCNATGGAFNVTLPATTTPGVRFTIKKVDASANAVTIVATVDGTVNPTLAAQWSSITVVSTSTSGTWYKVASV